MKKYFLTAFTAVSMLLSATVFAQDDAELPTYRPVETFTCTYNDGMGPDDLDAITDKWNAWMDENGENTYFAATVTPVYYGDDAFDFGWIGAWSSGTTMGAGSDRWMNESGELPAGYAAVADCNTHSGFASTQLKEPSDGEGDGSFLLTFTDCTITSDDPAADVVGALQAWADYATERGYQNGMWLMWPVYGGGGAEFDFKIVNGYSNFADLGSNWDLFASGDYVKAGEIAGGLYECDDARVYAATLRREMAEE